MVPAVSGGDLFLYNWRNPRRQDAQEARVLAFYRALGLRGGEEAARGLWRGVFRVEPLCRLAMFLNQVRNRGEE